MKPIHTIDDVIDALEEIVQTSIVTGNPMGYFAALYQKVTIKVKEGIQNNFFDDGSRMEKLDVIFAKRYIDAYYSYQANQKVTDSWQVAFDLSKDFWPIVLQHLLIGMNAHINLDLGIAAAQVSTGKPIQDLKGDFDKINQILSLLVSEVQEDLEMIWPTLKKILQWTKKVDDFLIDFSMELARDGAWKFANELSVTPADKLEEAIIIRDQKVSDKAKIITSPGWIASLILGIIRLGEKGTVAKRIENLQS